MIRHASMSSTVPTIALGVQLLPVGARLISGARLSLVATSRLLRTASAAIDVATIATATNENLTTAASAEIESAGAFPTAAARRARMILLQDLCVQGRAQPSAPQLPASLPTRARLSKGGSSPCVRMAAVPLRAFDNDPRATVTGRAGRGGETALSAEQRN
jgi:hypothetical protein